MNLDTLLPLKARQVVYLITLMLAAAYAVVEANVNLHYGWVAAYAAWNAGSAALAISNARPTEPPPPEGGE